jgi:hypothetical protein
MATKSKPKKSTLKVKDLKAKKDPKAGLAAGIRRVR